MPEQHSSLDLEAISQRLESIRRRNNNAADRAYWPSWQDVTWLIAEVEQLREQIAAMEPVVEAARHLVNSNAQIPGAPELSHVGTSLIDALRARLDAWRKGQPE